MKDSASLRGEIVNRMWNNINPDCKRDPSFHKWLEELIKRDRQELHLEILNKVLDEAGTHYEAVEILKNFKIK